MAQASRDPVYLAAQAVANQDIPGVGEYCIRCHSPSGWMEGRSKAPDGSEVPVAVEIAAALQADYVVTGSLTVNGASPPTAFMPARLKFFLFPR